MKNLLFLLFLMPLLSNCQTEKASVSKYPAQVGDILFDKRTDDPNFKRCIPENKYAYQYYNDSKGFQYKGEKLAIIEKLSKTDLKTEEKFNGYIIIRFLVNCEGKTDLFRVKQIDSDYHEVNQSNQLKDKLLNFTKSLDAWIPKEIEGKKIDYYQYINYKIVDGKVSEILP